MLFNSIEFLIFFPIVTLLYFLVPQKWKWLLLLVASYYFYMSWKVEYIILILLSTAIDYFASYRMGTEADERGRKKYLYLSLGSNLGLLFFFKYFNFFNDSFSQLFNFLDMPYLIPSLDVLLPVGISFYTFQTLSYTIDVYHGRIQPERHFGIFALYVSFWPQLVAGPIERAETLLPQLKSAVTFDYDRVRNGLIRMAWGFFKKVVIADRLSVYVESVYGSPEQFGAIPLTLGTLFFAFQIYCDFSGYSDIAIGAAQVLGIKLMENFKRPYFSRSISEFWRRWHISLSTWFRDYVYIPLGGNRVLKWRWYYNLFITFLVSGLWHGANWTFVAWGALHGSYIIVEIALRPTWRSIKDKKSLAKFSFVFSVLEWFITFSLVLIAWVFFRANSFSDAFMVFQNVIQGSGQINTIPTANGIVDYNIAIVCLVILLLVETALGDRYVESALAQMKQPVRWVYYVVLTLSIFWFGVFTNSQFIYFQF